MKVISHLKIVLSFTSRGDIILFPPIHLNGVDSFTFHILVMHSKHRNFVYPYYGILGCDV